MTPNEYGEKETSPRRQASQPTDRPTSVIFDGTCRLATDAAAAAAEFENSVIFSTAVGATTT